MNCKEFREIADSYLSNELLVETNHEILQHLEHCTDCRRELGARRELREVLRVSVKNDLRNQINPIFAKKLTNNLRENAFGKSVKRIFSNPRMVIAGVFAALIFAVGLTLFIRQTPPVQTVDVPPTPNIPANTNQPRNDANLYQVSFAAVQKDAVDDHKNCALTHNLKERPISLKESAKIYAAADANFDTAVFIALRQRFGKKIKFIKAHSCVINGRRFAHVIYEIQGKIVSVLMTKREKGDSGGAGEVSACNSSNDLQTACFTSGDYHLFVVSDAPETENTLIAQTIKTPLDQHIEKSKS